MFFIRCSAQVAEQDSIRYMKIIDYLTNNASKLNRYAVYKDLKFKPSKMLICAEKNEFQPAFVIDSLYMQQSQAFRDSISLGSYSTIVYRETWAKDKCISTILSSFLENEMNLYLDRKYKRTISLQISNLKNMDGFTSLKYNRKKKALLKSTIVWCVFFSISYQNCVQITIHPGYERLRSDCLFELTFLFDESHHIRYVDIKYFIT
jgi:hypothetical protein